MCRTGGRRCPSSVPQSDVARRAKNSKRRLDYATKRAEALQEESIAVGRKVKEGVAEVHDRIAISSKLNAAIAARNTAAATRMNDKIALEEENSLSQLDTLKQRAIPSPSEIDFPKDGFAESTALNSKDEDNMWYALNDKLSSPQKAALEHYTGDWAFSINYQLREGYLHKQETPEQTAKRVEWYASRGHSTIAVRLDEKQHERGLIIASDMDDIIEKHSTATEPRLLWRGIQGSGKKDLLEAEVGSVVELPAYTSTARSADEAGHFARMGKEDSTPQVVMEFLTKKGLDIGSAAEFHETETILPRNTKWRIAGQYETIKHIRGSDRVFNVVQLVDEDHLNDLDKGTAKDPSSLTAAGSESKSKNSKNTEGER